MDILLGLILGCVVSSGVAALVSLRSYARKSFALEIKSPVYKSMAKLESKLESHLLLLDQQVSAISRRPIYQKAGHQKRAEDSRHELVCKELSIIAARVLELEEEVY